MTKEQHLKNKTTNLINLIVHHPERVSINNYIARHFRWENDILYENNEDEINRAFDGMEPWDIIQSLTSGYKMSDPYFVITAEANLHSFNPEDIKLLIIQNLTDGMPYLVTGDHEVDYNFWLRLCCESESETDQENSMKGIWEYINANFIPVVKSPASLEDPLPF